MTERTARTRAAAARTAAVFRHVAHEGLGTFARPLAEAGFAVRGYDAWARPRYADAADAALLVVMGGPMGVYEADAHAFLRDELAVIEARLAAGRPTLGVCLGAQLIASAAGARVYRGDAFEIGFAPVRLSAAGRRSCLAPLADAPVVLHWHGDTFDLPRGAVRLASSERCREQAFAIGTHALALQFHLEVGGELEHWIERGGDDLRRGGVDAATLRVDAGRHGAALAAAADAVLAAWLASACGAPAR
ncbi:MAG TPA: glutamine amidotransferase [Dokdonella sp.]